MPQLEKNTADRLKRLINSARAEKNVRKKLEASQQLQMEVGKLTEREGILKGDT